MSRRIKGLTPSRAGKKFAANHSEVMFLPGLEPEKTRLIVDDMRYGRDTLLK
jgi:hypothetical protein